LRTLAENDVTVNLGAAGAGLTLARLLCPIKQNQDEEVVFLSDLFDYLGAYFSEGTIN
jgi:hypothetical protein